MNTNPSAKTVLCFGDSNTYGQTPHKEFRYPANQRWTGRLQDKLGDDYYVIEEGMGGRTTNFDPGRPDRNGRTYLLQTLQSHNPLDFIVIMIGTNDAKIPFNRTVDDTVDAIADMLDLAPNLCNSSNGDRTKVVLLSPAKININADNFALMYNGVFNEESADKVNQLESRLEELAGKRDTAFLDIAQYANTGEDGVHFDEDSNERVADIIAKTIKELV